MSRTPPLSLRQDNRTELTTDDLLRMCHDTGYAGFGYLGHQIRQSSAWYGHSRTPYAMPELLDQAVVDSANCRNWSYEQLFYWANSREGRHAGDQLCGEISERDREMVLDASMRRAVRDEDFPAFAGGGKACRHCGDEMENGECQGCGWLGAAMSKRASR